MFRCCASDSSIQLCGDCHKWHSLSSGSDWWSHEACRCIRTTGLDSV